MPNINRIRVNNIKYNFGTQAYDDFVMKPFGQNTLYDLANGGGKSVLMLLMLQTVLPNCTLDEKQPIEKLFRTNEGSQTIHSLIEWNLDSKDIHQGFQYMTTGFCARKATSNVVEASVSKDTASIEYFNYCIFYREYNQNDIRNLPLVKDKEKITYTGLRKYLKELERDNSYIVKLYDRKGEYQSFISQFGIYESEWEIIRGINKTEGHVRTYFESNYKTTRKVVEDLLIEEIIEKSFRLKSGNNEAGDVMSRTLLDIKDRLLDLAKKKDEISAYDKQIEIISNFAVRIESILQMYHELSDCENEIGNIYSTVSHMYESTTSSLAQKKAESIAYKEQLFSLSKSIDAVKYFMDRNTASDLLKQVQALEDELSVLNEKHAQLQQLLLLKESFNDYLEYQEEKKKRDEVSQAIAAIENKSTSLIDEIHSLAYHYKERLSLKQEKLKKELLLEEEKIDVLLLREQELDYKSRLIEKELAVSNSRIIQANETNLELIEAISKLKNKVGLLIIEDIIEVEASHLKKIDNCKDYQKLLINSLIENEKEYSNAEHQVIQQEHERNRLEKTCQDAEGFFKEYDEYKARIDRLCSVYGKKNCEDLLKDIKDRFKNNIKNIEEDKKRLRTLEAEIKRLQEKTFLSNNETLLYILDEIKVNKDFSAVTGEDYLFQVSESERIELLSHFPYLPYSLVIKKGFEVLKKDLKLCERLSLDCVIPMIEESALIYSKDVMHSEYFGLLTKDQAILFDADKLEKEIVRRHNELLEVRHRLRILEEQESTYLQDEANIQEFILRYENKSQDLKKDVALCNEQIQDFLRSIAMTREDMEQLLMKKEVIRENLKKLEDEMKQLDIDSVVLKDLSRCLLESKQQENTLVEESRNLERLEVQQHVVKEEFDNLSLEIRSMEGICKSKRESLEDLETTWTKNYEHYYMEGDYPAIHLSDEELVSSLNGKCLAFSTEHTDIEDKKRLVISYVNGMNRCLKSISNRGISTESLSQMQTEGKLYSVSDKEITRLYQEVSQIELETQKKSTKLQDKRAEFNRLDGKSGQALSAFEEKYGKMADLSSNELNANQIINRNKQQILQFQHELAVLDNEQIMLTKRLENLQDIKKEMERCFKNTAILTVVKEIIQKDSINEDNIEKIYENCMKSYDHLIIQIKAKQDDFTRNKEKSIDFLKDLQATGLAEEMRTSVLMPKNAEEATQLLNNLREVNECICLEKSMILRGIEDMQTMKENFENQCLQRCNHIKTELERLSKLSKILLDGEHIHMLNLSIPYVKEEFVNDKMSNYIDDIVYRADECSSADDRLKFIKSALSLKKLFSVIVTDMNHIKLTLYKRERIKEQSRHLRYEEAVGSTGQSQGIYIQFLIAIINYISNINSSSIDNTGLLKVIFIDNPFGAAKDVYIWEPIFELLKSNQVQLIVPARGTTPAITGRFDVNYVLGQKIIDGRQQTVVVDYQSRVDAKEIEYIPIQYEQTSMDWFEEQNN